ncbi:MAG: hypothetical protein RR980_04030 [Mucinivorans sp.]
MKREQITTTIREKSVLKQQVYDRTHEVMQELKEILAEYASEVNDQIEGLDRRIKLEYRDRGKLEAQLQIAGDVLIFSMHTNVFKFDRSHPIWQNSYVEADSSNGYCGVINIYNFLSDSLKFNRTDDLGYLIARVFVNREKQYFVEGKRQMEYRHNNFGQGAISSQAIVDIVENAIIYALDFDLLVPPYALSKQITVESVNTKIEMSRLKTGKRLGYQFNVEDI